MFLDLLTNLMRDTSDLRGILSILLHFLTSARDLAASQSTHVKASVSAVSRQDTSDGNEWSRWVPSIEPVVLIRDADRLTRMVCPVVSMVNTHSTILADQLQVNVVYVLCCVCVLLIHVDVHRMASYHSWKAFQTL